jgi:hypothetical protein
LIRHASVGHLRSLFSDQRNNYHEATKVSFSLYGI